MSIYCVQQFCDDIYRRQHKSSLALNLSYRLKWVKATGINLIKFIFNDSGLEASIKAIKMYTYVQL